MNVKFIISYDGSLYKGSQKQPDVLTIEDELLLAFKNININTSIILSGRTDKEVHATGQVFNCILPSFWNDFKKLKKVLNHQLPLSIRVLNIKEVPEDFHSRFHARKRVYRYIVTTKEVTAFNNKYITYKKNINEDIIKKAIKEFIGIYDFEYFHKQGSEKENTVREIYKTMFYKHKDFYVFKFTANSYLRSQIRLMVGFLLKISDGKLTISDLKSQLSKSKQIHRIPSDANGLYLSKVIY